MVVLSYLSETEDTTGRKKLAGNGVYFLLKEACCRAWMPRGLEAIPANGIAHISQFLRAR